MNAHRSPLGTPLPTTPRAAGRFVHPVWLRALATVVVGAGLMFSGANAQSVNVNKDFAPNLVNPGEVTTMTIRLFNSSNTAITGVNLTDFFTSDGTSGGTRATNGLIVANPPDVVVGPGCGSPTITAPAGAISVAIAGGAIPAKSGSVDGQCAISLKVFSRLQAANTNIIPAGALAATQAGVTNTEAQATLNVRTAAAPGFSKAINPSTLNTGQPSVMTITIANTGSGTQLPLTNYAFTDALPAGLTTVGTATKNAACSGGTVTATPGANSTLVASGISVAANTTCVVTVNVTSTTRGTYTNSIPVGGMTTDQFANPNTVSAPVTFQGLVASKAFSNGTPVLNAPFNMTLTFTTGSQQVNNLSFSDAFPAGLEVASATLGTNTCNGSFTPALAPGQTSLSYSGGTLNANTTGGTNTCTVVVSVRATTTGSKTNTIPAANITGTGITAESPISATVNPSSGSNGANVIAVTKSFNPNPVTTGGTSRLTINIAPNNPGANDLPLTAVSVTDALPTGMTVAGTPNVNVGSGCNFTGQPAPSVNTSNSAQVAITNVSFSSQTTCTIAVDVVVGSNASYVNNIPTGNITGTAPSGTKTDSDGTGNVTLNTTSGLAVNKSFSPTQTAPGNTVRLTVNIANSRPTALTNFSLTDTFPNSANNALVLATPPNPSVLTGTNCSGTVNATGGAGSVSVTGANIPANTTCSFQVDVLVPTGSTATSTNTIQPSNITNTQNVTVPSNATADLTKVAQLGVTKSFAPNPAPIGGLTTLTINIVNNRNIALTNFSLTDPFPTGATTALQVANPNGATFTGTGCTGTINATAGGTSAGVSGATIPANTTCVLTVNVRVPAGSTATSTNTIPAANVTNTQNVTIPADVSVNLTKSSGLTISKSFNPTTVPVGGISRLTITIDNNAIGQALTSFALTDPLPGPTATPPTAANTLLLVAPTPNALLTGCTGGTVTATAGATSVSVSGTTVPAATGAPSSITVGRCTLAVDVIAPGGSTAASLNTIPASSATNDQGITNLSPATATLNKSSGVTLAKSFTPTTIPVGGISRLRITINNNVVGTQLTSFALTDNLPGPSATPPTAANTTLLVAPTPNATLTGTNCTGTISATAGSGTVGITAGTVPGATNTTTPGVCVLEVDVIAPGISTAASPNTIPANNVTNTQNISNASAATATLNKIPGVTVAKSFNPTNVPVGGVTRMTVNVTNNITTSALTNFSLTDTFPNGANDTLVLSTPPNASALTGTGCTGTVNATGGAATVSITGATIPASGTCSFQVDVRAPTSSTATSTNTIRTTDVSNDQNVRPAADASATLTKTAPIAIAKQFSPTSIAVGGRSRVRVTLTNSAFNTQLTGVTVTDNLPAVAPSSGGTLVVASPPNVTIDTSCGTNATLTNGTGGALAAGATSVRLNNAIVLAPLSQGATTTCFYEFDVTAPTGSTTTSTNTIPAGGVTTDQGLTNASAATAQLTRTTATIIASKSFSPTNVSGGQPSTMTVRLENNTNTPFTGVNFVDNFPAGMIVYTPPNFTTTCPAGTSSAVGDATTAAFSGIRVNPNSFCNVTLQVTTTRSGNFPNVIPAGTITSFEGFTTVQDASATLTSLAGVGLTKSFTPATVAPNQVSQLAINIRNIDSVGGTTLTGVAVTDNLPTGVVVASTPGSSTTGCGSNPTVTAAAGATSVLLTGASIAPATTCTVFVNVTSATAGVYDNTINPNQLTNNQNLVPPQAATARLTVAAPPTISKTYNPTTIVQSAISRLTITLGNTNPVAIPVTLTSDLVDNLGTNVAIAGTPNLSTTCTTANVVAAASTNVIRYLSGSSIPAGGCTIAVDVTSNTPGTYPNTIPAGGLQTNVGNNAAPATATLTVTPPNASLSGRVYLDADNSGTFNAGDTGIGGQTVQLVDSGNNVVQSTTTAADGTYTFASVPPGTYTVRQPNQPANTINNVTNVGTGATTPGTATGVGTTPSQVSGVQLAAGNAAVNYNFGEVTPASLSGRVYLDADNSGTFNVGDTGIGSQTIELVDSGNNVVQSTTTAANGTYSFTNVRPGTGYTVRQPNQPANTLNNATNVGTGAATPGTASSVTTVPSTISGIALNQGSTAIDYNFGEVTPASLSGRVYSDIDRNNVLSAPDTGIGGQTIQLVDSGNNVVQTTTTAADGTYSFTGIRPGTGYTVRQPNQPANSSDAATNVGTGAATPGTATAVGVNNPDQITGIGLNPGNTAVNYNFGEILAQLAGRVYLDVDNNGTFNVGDTGIGSQTVQLLDSGNNVVQTTTTAADGTYSFTNLPAGTYTVRQPNQPANTINNVTNVGTGATTPGTATGVGTTPSQISGVQLAIADNAVNYNFGEVTPATLSGRVWNDLDNNGTFNPGEAISGQTIQLVDSGGNVVQTATTAADGTYSFTNIRPGTYTVRQPNQPANTIDGPTNPGTGASSPGTGTPVGTNNPDQITGVVLVPGSTAVNYNFLEYTPATLSGVVYGDNDATGTLTGPDSRLPGVTVELRNSGGTVLQTTTTAADGTYSFTNLLPGTYNVVEPTQPAGTTNATTNVGTGANVAGTATPIATTPSAINGVGLLPGNAAINYNFGETFIAGISGTVYRDNNDNGAIDGGSELGIQGILVELSGTVSRTTTTDASGGYSFDNLPPGTYTVTERGRSSNPSENQHPDFFNGKVTPGTTGAVTNGTPSAQTVTPSTITGIVLGTTSGANGNNNSRNNNFGEIPKSSLSGKVFETFNNDNIQQLAETNNLGGVPITLTYTDVNGNAVVQTTTTASGNVAGGATTNTISVNGGPQQAVTCSSAPTLTVGQYYFCEIRPLQTGTTYTVTETQPNGFSSNPANTAAGSAGGNTGVNNVVSGISFTPGTNATGYNFAEYQPVTIQGVVFAERNGTPNYQVGADDPIPGVTVSLRDSSGIPVPGVPDQTTPANGTYSFTNLPPGTYQVVEPTQPPGTVNDATFGGTVTGAPSGGTTVGSTGGTPTPIGTTPSAVAGIVTQSGNTVSNVNFGERYDGSISGVVFEDRNNDGIQNPGEPAIPGIVVRLSGPVSRPDAVTDANGAYSFTQLPPGTYTVTEFGFTAAQNQAPQYGNGQSIPGTTGAATNGTGSPVGTLPSTISGIVLGNTSATNNSTANNFGELTADLSLTKTVDNAAPAVGGTVKFTVTVTNKGPADATGVTVEDVLPAGFTYVSSTPSAGVTVVGQTITWTVGTVANGASTPLEITATVNPGQAPSAYVNAAEVKTSTIKDPNSTPGNGTGNNEDDRASVSVTPRGNINGTVFRDENGNGVRDPGELPISNANVIITPVGGGTPFTVTTDANGVFDTARLPTPGVPAGDYSVRIDENTLPTDYRNQSAGTNPTPVTVASGENKKEEDNGYRPTGTVTGSVFVDSNGNGVRDPGEPGIPNVPVTVSRPNVPGTVPFAPVTAQTDANGNYSVPGVPTGPAVVTVADNDPALNGFARVPNDAANNPGGNNPTPITVVKSSNNAGDDPFRNEGSVKERVFQDTNGNGVQDPGEPGIQGVTVRVTDSGGKVLTGVTDANGDVTIPGVIAGTATVTVDETTLPAGVRSQTAGINPSTVQVTTGQTADAGFDGYQPRGTVGGLVWRDDNGDGIRDPNEPIYPGVTVTITDQFGKVTMVVTGPDGRYSTPVASGPVTIVYTDPANTRLTTGNRTQTVNVPTNGNTNAADVGYQPLTGGLEGRVFFDTNANGVQDPGEPGIPNVPVRITDAQGNVVNLVTDENGNYRTAPNQLAFGPARVVVTPPPGLVVTTNNLDQTVNVPAGSIGRVPDVGLVRPGITLVKNVVQNGTVVPRTQTPTVALGGNLEYQISITNSGPVTLRELTVTDNLPLGLVYLSGTSKLEGVALADPVITNDATTGKQTLVWTLPTAQTLAPGATLRIRFLTNVTPQTSGDQLVNVASAVAKAGPTGSTVTVASNTSTAAVKVDLGVFTNKSLIVGRVYFDRNDNDSFEQNVDKPLAGARVYLSDGRSAITDATGRYSFPDVAPGVYTARLDPITAPYQVKRVPDDQGAPGSRYVRAPDGGGIIHEDFLLVEPKGVAVKNRSTIVQRGPVTLNKVLLQGGAGYAVTFTITVTTAVRDLAVTDPLPAGAERGPVTGATLDGNILRFPGVTQPGTYTVTYALFTALPPDLALTDPDINYQQIFTLIPISPGQPTAATPPDPAPAATQDVVSDEVKR